MEPLFIHDIRTGVNKEMGEFGCYTVLLRGLFRCGGRFQYRECSSNYQEICDDGKSTFTEYFCTNRSVEKNCCWDRNYLEGLKGNRTPHTYYKPRFGMEICDGRIKATGRKCGNHSQNLTSVNRSVFVYRLSPLGKMQRKDWL